MRLVACILVVLILALSCVKVFSNIQEFEAKAAAIRTGTAK